MCLHCAHGRQVKSTDEKKHQPCWTKWRNGQSEKRTRPFFRIWGETSFLFSLITIEREPEGFVFLMHRKSYVQARRVLPFSSGESRSSSPPPAFPFGRVSSASQKNGSEHELLRSPTKTHDGNIYIFFEALLLFKKK